METADVRAYRVVEVAPGVHASGTTSFHDVDQVLAAVAAAHVKVVLAITLMPDRRLEGRLGASGVRYVHSPLRAGSRPSWARRAVSTIASLRQDGGVLVVGETEQGPAMRLARHAADGTPLPTRGRMV